MKKEECSSPMDIDEGKFSAGKTRTLGIAKGKVSCPLTLDEFDKDNEEIATMFLNEAENDCDS